MHDLLHDSHVRVVAVVGHGYHGGRGQTPSETSRANLRVKLVKEVRTDRIVWEDIRVLRHDTG